MAGKEKKMPINKNVVFYITLGVTIILLIAGFILPPMGIIDSSVIQAAGILCRFSVVGQLPSIIESAKSVKLQAGHSSIEVVGHDKDKKEEE